MIFRINTIVNGKTYYVKYAKNSDFIWVCNRFDNATTFLDQWDAEIELDALDINKDYFLWESNQERIRIKNFRVEGSFW